MIIFFCKQTGFLGLWGNRVDAIDFYTSEIERLSEEVRNTILEFYFYLELLDLQASRKSESPPEGFTLDRVFILQQVA